MIMINLILILLVGGLLAMISERLGKNVPRIVALGIVLLDLVYLLSQLSGMSDLTQLQAPINPSNNEQCFSLLTVLGLSKICMMRSLSSLASSSYICSTVRK